jgi:hypothetical protein
MYDFFSPGARRIETELCIGQDDGQRRLYRSRDKHRRRRWHNCLPLHYRGAGPSPEVLQPVGWCEFHKNSICVKQYLASFLMRGPCMGFLLVKKL